MRQMSKEGFQVGARLRNHVLFTQAQKEFEKMYMLQASSVNGFPIHVFGAKTVATSTLDCDARFTRFPGPLAIDGKATPLAAGGP